ncbi:protein tyrosine phosphatase [Paraburkholderia sp. BL27I4N3]|uniref:low molecular weight protein-tyrosine-phosphatase n=1 Tax=Paraburkholderia sp. BL27I4N3 TaxID=1938805 RepID=UPI000E2843FB|nr:low molecular weight protein-tyrosine-phosphatase [Paraburkholderia sp. BL27I4N3]REE22812.1 protein tyrosine phosphatase [Paraburkholderia sp. BL27I4N3]
MIRRLLVVCQGNLCRSPMAQGLFQRLLPDISVSSAGLAARQGMTIDPVAGRMLELRGIDMSSHRAVRLDEGICRSADLILVMELEQRRAIERFYPVARGRIYRVAEVFPSDVKDPYQRSQRNYDYAMTLIEHSVNDWVERICQLAESNQR